MALELRQLRFAVLAADAGSFSRAATMLNVKQATLSKAIAILERQVGIALFQRSTRGAIPTKAGGAFLDRARRIVEDIDDLNRNARAVGRGEAGTFTIGFCASLSAGNLRVTMIDFLRRYPAIQLKAIEADQDRLRDGLQSGAIDVAIVTSDLNDRGILKRPLWPERIMVAMREDHVLATRETIYWTDLRQESFVLPSRYPGPDMAAFLRSRLTQPGQDLKITLQDMSHENVLNMISAGQSVTLTCEASLGVIHPGVTLRGIHDATGQSRVDFAAYWREDNDNPALQGFFALVSERYPAPPLV